MSKITEPIFLPIAIVEQAFRAVRFRLRLSTMHRRYSAFRWFAEREKAEVQPPLVLAVITHVVSKETARGENPADAQAKIERFIATMDGLLNTLSHCKITIICNTVTDQNLLHLLPDYQRNAIAEVRYQDDCDPMMIEYRSQDIFLEYKDTQNTIVFLEDDCVLHDTMILEKKAHFNAAAPAEDMLLMPNRYEMYQGIKRYIDTYDMSGAVWNAATQFEADGIRFAEFANPHSATHFLTRQQLERWDKTGRTFQGKVVYIGPLESAATGVLFEAFTLYRPHYTNIHYLEVQHWDEKYSRQYTEGGDPARLGAKPMW